MAFIILTSLAHGRLDHLDVGCPLHKPLKDIRLVIQSDVMMSETQPTTFQALIINFGSLPRDPQNQDIEVDVVLPLFSFILFLLLKTEEVPNFPTPDYVLVS